eukprot:CAMPEP_0194769946 /NCGR_PEP_ID=MMETSP0323_2-20130528/44743_1 /TAXON_ID=2866 ORGANISM="Crypthecodinium cohnii, Strain Seligo" /NCGR_SAMPLE_ID=MMETSP0323_2 /ASSEMBLY_ACC=CAM_ASM_000346 /LENGTH=70 /DNA_ID=CAMNT_0039703223 /DNA_START=63 /DNA_END=271 /DNA_ORIENTATION=+
MKRVCFGSDAFSCFIKGAPSLPLSVRRMCITTIGSGRYARVRRTSSSFAFMKAVGFSSVRRKRARKTDMR